MVENVRFSNGPLARTVLYIKRAKLYLKWSRLAQTIQKPDHSNTGHVRYSDGYCSYLLSYTKLITLCVRLSCILSSFIQFIFISETPLPIAKDDQSPTMKAAKRKLETSEHSEEVCSSLLILVLFYALFVQWSISTLTNIFKHSKCNCKLLTLCYFVSNTNMLSVFSSPQISLSMLLRVC